MVTGSISTWGDFRCAEIQNCRLLLSCINSGVQRGALSLKNDTLLTSINRQSKAPKKRRLATCQNSFQQNVTTRGVAIGLEAHSIDFLTSPELEVEPARDLFPSSYYTKDGRLMLKCLTLPELEAWCASIEEKEPAKRALQIWRWMYYDRQWIRSFDDAPAEITNGFSVAFRNKVRDIATIDGGLQVESIHSASDGTRKIVFKLTAGPGAGGQVETVLIPIVRESGTKERITLCVSSQVGCAMGCQFCYTGRMGLLGNLTPGQIVEQVVVARRLLYEEHLAQHQQNGQQNGRQGVYVTNITNIVYMGMGEPMDNLDAVLPSIDIVTQPLGLHFSFNKICVSTVGLVPQLRKFAQLSKAVLAVSLHAATDEVRDSIVPVNRRYPLADVVAALEELCPKDRAAPRHGYHVLIEYTMLRGVNDRKEDAEALIELLKNVRCKINLIVFNPHEGTAFQPSTPEAVTEFRGILIKKGHVATVRCSRGDDQMAACGQLGNLELVQKTRRERKLQSVV